MIAGFTNKVTKKDDRTRSIADALIRIQTAIARETIAEPTVKAMKPATTPGTMGTPLGAEITTATGMVATAAVTVMDSASRDRTAFATELTTGAKIAQPDTASDR